MLMVHNGAPPWKTVQQFLRKLSVELLRDPALPSTHTLGAHPGELETRLTRKLRLAPQGSMTTCNSQKVETTQIHVGW